MDSYFFPIILPSFSSGSHQSNNVSSCNCTKSHGMPFDLAYELNNRAWASGSGSFLLKALLEMDKNPAPPKEPEDWGF